MRIIYYKWFAWYPVRTDDVGWVWWDYVNVYESPWGPYYSEFRDNDDKALKDLYKDGG